MSDFAGLSVPRLKNLFFQKAQLSSARVALYEPKGKNASVFFAFFQLRRLRQKSASAGRRFSVILPDGCFRAVKKRPLSVRRRDAFCDDSVKRAEDQVAAGRVDLDLRAAAAALYQAAAHVAGHVICA